MNNESTPELNYDIPIGIMLDEISKLADTKLYTIITRSYEAENQLVPKGMDIRKYFFPVELEISDDKVITDLIQMAQNDIWTLMDEKESEHTLLRTDGYLAWENFSDLVCIYTYLTDNGAMEIMLAHWPYKNLEELASTDAYGITAEIFELVKEDPYVPIVFNKDQLQTMDGLNKLVNDVLLDCVQAHEGEEGYLNTRYNTIAKLEIFPQVPLYSVEKS